MLANYLAHTRQRKYAALHKEQGNSRGICGIHKNIVWWLRGLESWGTIWFHTNLENLYAGLIILDWSHRHFFSIIFTFLSWKLECITGIVVHRFLGAVGQGASFFVEVLPPPKTVNPSLDSLSRVVLRKYHPQILFFHSFQRLIGQKVSSSTPLN